MNDDRYLAVLRDYWKQHNSFPSLAKLGKELGLSSTSSVFALVNRLSDAGYLQRQERRVAPTRKFFARGLLGPVRAGLPQAASQEEPEHLTLDDYLIDEPNRTSLHRVKGDSMKNAGIFDGDLLAVEHNSPTKPGDIVVACADNEMTVKYLRSDRDNRYYLQAANEAYPDIRPKHSLELLGVVVSLARRVRRHPK